MDLFVLSKLNFNLAKDCKQRRPGELWNQRKGTCSKVIDKEYDAFLNDMGAKNKKNEFATIPPISGGVGSGASGGK